MDEQGRGSVMTKYATHVSLKVFGQTDVGVVRTNNEDAFIISALSQETQSEVTEVSTFDADERGILLAGSVGMGGAQAGEVACALVIDTMRDEIGRGDEIEDTGQMVIHAVEEANRNVWEAASVPGQSGMGATLTAIYIRGVTAYIAEVGDSRA